MSVRFLVVRVVFALALLAQALAPVSAGRATSASAGPLCAILHGAKQSAVAGVGSDQAPDSDHSHRHGFCSHCQIGSSPPPFEPCPTPTTLLRSTWTRLVFFRPHSDVVAVFRGNLNAPARAPPSFA